ncbi:2-C-methyl-D-erythritol 2,4-cyclodiphosphate synthase, partial [Pseudoalteromonas sp. c7(2019)]|uniref:2-C-methyl-D-erythritol 2,4-cyclodiphosphate synthase n=1 Tax=Pseudoalteromonas sp. c7(2019) TaxID=2687287 RepID=UPI0013FD8D79
HDRGLLAHSDGDVAIHALCDAILGALALGDIGRHFPDNDDAFKGIDSRELLVNVYGQVKERGYRLGNADITIVAQAPKMAPFIDQMCAELTRLLETDENN